MPIGRIHVNISFEGVHLACMLDGMEIDVFFYEGRGDVE